MKNIRIKSDSLSPNPSRAGSIYAHRVSRSPSLLYKTKLGIDVNTVGRTKFTTHIIRMKILPLNLYLASPYPAKDDESKIHSVGMTDSNILFPNAFIYDNDFFKKYFQNSITPAFVGRIDYLPFHREKWRLGFETLYSQTNYKYSNYYYDLNLASYLLQGNLVFRYALGKKKLFWLSVKGGGGLSFMQINLQFKGSFQGRNNINSTYAYPLAGGGCSVILIPKQLITLELGFDYYNLFMDGYNTGIISPYIGGGIRF